jgi:hypothetical protein
MKKLFATVAFAAALSGCGHMQAMYQADYEESLKPEPKIGMTMQQVIDETKYGRPTRHNTSNYASGRIDQFVYDTVEKHGYMNFENGILTSTQDLHTTKLR